MIALRKTHWWFLALAGVLLALAAGRLLRRGDVGERYVAHTVRQSRAETRYHFRGVLESSSRIPVMAKTDGRIMELLPQGTTVHKGDKLFMIDDSTAKEQIENQEEAVSENDLTCQLCRTEYDTQKQRLENQVELCRAQLEYSRLQQAEELNTPDERQRRRMEIEEEIALLDLQDAQANYDRQFQMYQKKFVSKSALEPYEQSLENARANLEEIQLKNQIERKGITAERRTELEKIVQRSEVQLNRREFVRERRLGEIHSRLLHAEKTKEIAEKTIEHAREQVDNAVVYSPVDGIFLVQTYRDWSSGYVLRELKEGDEKKVNDIIGYVIDIRGMQVRFVANEADAMRLAVGMTVDVKLPAIPGKMYQGRISQLGAIGRERGNSDPTALGTGTSEVMVFSASLELKGEDERFHPGMSAEICVHGDMQDGIFVERTFLEWQDGKPFVYTRPGVLKPVEGMVFNDMLFLVRSGLEEGEVIYSRVAGDGMAATDEEQKGTGK